MLYILQEISEPEEFIDKITGFSKERVKALYRSYQDGQRDIREQHNLVFVNTLCCLYVPSNFIKVVSFIAILLHTQQNIQKQSAKFLIPLESSLMHKKTKCYITPELVKASQTGINKAL